MRYSGSSSTLSDGGGGSVDLALDWLIAQERERIESEG
jgi:hypothetical protein